MGKRKLTGLAQVLILVDSLSADDITTLAGYLQAHGFRDRAAKSTAPNAGKKLSRKGSTDALAANTGGETESALAAGGSGD